MGKSKGRKPGQQGDRSEQNVPLIKEPDIVVASTASLSPGEKKLLKALENRRKEEEFMNAAREVEKKKEAESKRKPKTNKGSTPKKRIELPDMAKEGERKQTVEHQATPVYPHTDFTKSVDVPEEGATEQGEKKFKYQVTPFARSNPGYREHNPRVEASDYGCQNVPYSYKMEKNDLLFKTFMYKKNINCDRIIEKKGDLFSAPEEYSLAHCVAEDFNMGAGIALTFRSKYKQVAYLLDQNQRTGGLAVLNDNQRFIYYLVTKKISRGKPTLYTLWLSLQKLKKHCEDNNVTKLAIPQIGCGLDRLDWETVKRMLAHVFEETPVEIVVYIWEQPSKRGKRGSKYISVRDQNRFTHNFKRKYEEEILTPIKIKGIQSAITKKLKNDNNSPSHRKLNKEGRKHEEEILTQIEFRAIQSAITKKLKSNNNSPSHRKLNKEDRKHEEEILTQIEFRDIQFAITKKSKSDNNSRSHRDLSKEDSTDAPRFSTASTQRIHDSDFESLKTKFSNGKSSKHKSSKKSKKNKREKHKHARRH